MYEIGKYNDQTYQYVDSTLIIEQRQFINSENEKMSKQLEK